MISETENNDIPAEDTESTVPDRSGRPDVWIAASLGLASLAFLSLTWRTLGVQSDESINIYGALRMLAGERIYRDFWVYHTPGIYFLTATIFRVFGESLLAVRMVLIASASVTASGIYLLGRKFMSRGFAALASALFVALGVNLWSVGGYNWYSTFVFIFSVLFIARFLEDRSRSKSLFAGGFLVALTFLFHLPKGAALLLLVFPFLLAEEFAQRDDTPRLQRLIRTGGVFAAGAATSISLAAAYFALTGTLGDAVSAAIGYPIRLLFQMEVEQGYGVFYGNLTRSTLSQLAGVSPLPGNGEWAVTVAGWLINYVGPLSIAVAGGAWLVRRLKGKEANAIAALCSVAALAIFGAALQRPDFFHLLTSAPLSYMTLAYVIHCVFGTAEEGKPSPIRRVAGIAIVCVIALSCASIVAGRLFHASRLEAVSTGSRLGFSVVPKGRADAAFGDPLVKVIDYIQLNTAEDDTVFAMSYSPFIYYLSERRNPTPYLDIPSSPCIGGTFHGMKQGHASSNLERLENSARALEADRTPIVILDPAAACQVRDEWEEAGIEDEPLIKYIKDHYAIEADLGLYVIMRRAD